ncbi:MAG TPA: APC family permease [Acidobacteriota bacterium]|nr:APC family permease [Acidobacteriota bacterium]
MQTEGLIRAIGVFGAGLIVLNSMIGAGIYALPSALAPLGRWGPWMFIAAGLAMATVVITFARLASYFERTGGPVLYTYEAFGPFVCFQTGWLLYLGRVTAMAANTSLLVDYAARFAPVLGTPTARAVTIAAVVGLLTWANVAGVRQGMAAMTALTILKISPLLLLVTVALSQAAPELFWPADPLPVDDLGSAALLLVYAMVGFEGALVTAGETRNPTRTIPLALVPTVLGVAGFYALIQWAYVSLGSAVDPDSPVPLADAAHLVLGPHGATLLTLTAVFSIAGNLAAILVAAPRMTFALGREGLLPGWFAGVNLRTQAPSHSIIFLAVAAALLAISGTFLILAAMSSLARMLAYMISMASLPAIRRTRGEAAWKSEDILAVLALLVCGWVALQSTTQGWLTLFAFAAIGTVLYALERRNQSS